jgi:hypothetical protein
MLFFGEGTVAMYVLCLCQTLPGNAVPPAAVNRRGAQSGDSRGIAVFCWSGGGGHQQQQSIIPTPAFAINFSTSFNKCSKDPIPVLVVLHRYKGLPSRCAGSTRPHAPAAALDG